VETEAPDPRDLPAQLVNPDTQEAMETMAHPDPEDHPAHPDKTDIQDRPASLVPPVKSWTDPDPLDPPAQPDLRDLPDPMAAPDNPASPVTMVDLDQWEMPVTMVVLANPETPVQRAQTEMLATRALATTARHPVPHPDIKHRRLHDLVDVDDQQIRIAKTFSIDECRRRVVLAFCLLVFTIANKKINRSKNSDE